MIPGNIYQRGTYPMGFFVNEGGVFSREFGKYKIIEWDEYPRSDHRKLSRYDLFRLSDGPEEFMGAVYLTEDREEWIACINRLGLRENSLSSFQFGNLSKAFKFILDFSEKELEEQFELAFQVG